LYLGKEAQIAARYFENVQTILGDLHDAVVTQQFLQSDTDRAAGVLGDAALPDVIAALGERIDCLAQNWRAPWDSGVVAVKHLPINKTSDS
jgi:CHAD domain-containing protein